MDISPKFNRNQFNAVCDAARKRKEPYLVFDEGEVYDMFENISVNQLLRQLPPIPLDWAKSGWEIQDCFASETLSAGEMRGRVMDDVMRNEADGFDTGLYSGSTPGFIFVMSRATRRAA